MRKYVAAPLIVIRDEKESAARVARAFEYGTSLKLKSPAAMAKKTPSKTKK
jgi:hypothetical protein